MTHTSWEGPLSQDGGCAVGRGLKIPLGVRKLNIQQLYYSGRRYLVMVDVTNGSRFDITFIELMSDGEIIV